MKQPHILLKVGVVVSALLLTSGLISYRVGAFNRFMSPSATPAPETMLGGSKSKTIIAPAAPKPANETPPAAPQLEPSDRQPSPPLFIMSGSKSFAPPGGVFAPPNTSSTPPPAIAQQPAQDTTPPKPTIVIPSPKAGPIFTPPPAPNPNPPPPQTNAPSPPSNPSR